MSTNPNLLSLQSDTLTAALRMRRQRLSIPPPPPRPVFTDEETEMQRVETRRLQIAQGGGTALALTPGVLMPNTCCQSSLCPLLPGRSEASTVGNGSLLTGAGWGSRSYAESWGTLGTCQRALSGLACPSQVQHQLSAQDTASLCCKRGAEGSLRLPTRGQVTWLTDGHTERLSQ